jgi:ribose transport system substrate-binding protein
MRNAILLASIVASTATVATGLPARADAASDGLAKAKANLVAYTAKPVFTAPGPAFDAKKCAAGQKMLSIPNNSGNPFLKGIIDREKAAGKLVGLEVKEWENQGQPSQWVQGMEYAIRDKFDIVDLISGIDPGTIEPQVKAAKEAGVKVMTSHFYDPSFKPNPFVSSSLTIGFGEIGKIWRTGPQRLRTASEYRDRRINGPADDPLVANFKSELAAVCPQYQIVQEINVGVTEWGTRSSQLSVGGQANRTSMSRCRSMTRCRSSSFRSGSPARPKR